MGAATMGAVRVPVRIESIEDLFRVKQGTLTADQVRTIDIPDALVDTGASGLMLPTRFVQQLGLKVVRERRARTVNGETRIRVYEVVRLTVQGRDCTVEVNEIGDDNPTLIGQVPLEILDWVVDPAGQRLIGNPEHGGEWMMDAFTVR